MNKQWTFNGQAAGGGAHWRRGGGGALASCTRAAGVRCRGCRCAARGTCADPCTPLCKPWQPHGSPRSPVCKPQGSRPLTGILPILVGNQVRHGKLQATGRGQGQASRQHRRRWAADGAVPGSCRCPPGQRQAVGEAGRGPAHAVPASQPPSGGPAPCCRGGFDHAAAAGCRAGRGLHVALKQGIEQAEKKDQKRTVLNQASSRALPRAMSETLQQGEGNRRGVSGRRLGGRWGRGAARPPARGTALLNLNRGRAGRRSAEPGPARAEAGRRAAGTGRAAAIPGAPRPLAGMCPSRHPLPMRRRNRGRPRLRPPGPLRPCSLGGGDEAIGAGQGGDGGHAGLVGPPARGGARVRI